MRKQKIKFSQIFIIYNYIDNSVKNNSDKNFICEIFNIFNVTIYN